MSEGFVQTPADQSQKDASDERFLLRNPLQIRSLLSAMIEQRSLVSAHISGRDQAFPSVLLEVDDDDFLWLDASPSRAVNLTAELAEHLLCFAQLHKVKVRFHVAGQELHTRDGHPAFRVPLPESVHHLQRREFYRLETPVAHPPTCRFRLQDIGGEVRELTLRVLDMSGGGLAVALPCDGPTLATHGTYADCVLNLPDHPPIVLALTVCNQFGQTLANGQETRRVGMRFEHLPRGADEAILRYIFRIERQRNARKSGLF
ncbi:flagellar brake protein [Stenotrophomonas sp. MMGLT7]|uniref:flagellar brake protein n=1 Tax=Stenotrophomonas sp. MMGLT7 TaxID=2901227 RepID=UPI001E494B4A|nr:flagellar brake protein [Stenotrophomonas sp. MMGLT7]MCD7097092.1 flagellar brake protein [Stenotrophomonas sp. MMGLT7]